MLRKERDEIARQLKESNSKNSLLLNEVREANKKLDALEKTVVDYKLQVDEWATVRSQHTSQIEDKDEQITDLEYRLESACLESSISTQV